MAPKLSEISQLEQLSASETPSAEGAWWIMLQTAESICNFASRRDPVNNAYITEFWSEAAPGVEDFVSKKGSRPLPYDDLMQMISFCGDHLQEIVKNPRHNLVKADRMVRPEKARNIGYKTINWLGKQPGRSVREKMAGKQTLLTQIKEYSFDIKENQAAMMLYQQLMGRVSDRMNNGLKMGAYDDSGNEQMMQMWRIKKLLRESPLRGVAPKNQNQANNVLLSDKNYSIIWRAYMDMNRFDTRLEDRWRQALALYVKAVFLAINAELISLEDVYVIEKRMKLNENEDFHVSYIVGYHYKIPYVIDIKVLSKTIVIEIYDVPLNGARRSDFMKEMKLTFSDAVSKNKMESRRGTPLSVEIKEDGKGKKKLFFADLSCIQELTALCRDKIFDFADIEPVKRDTDQKKRPASVSFDMIGNGTSLGIAGEKIEVVNRFYSNKAVAYKNNDSSHSVFPNGRRSIHLHADGNITVRDVVESEDSRGLKAVLDEIHENITLGQDDYFFYLVPDALEELRQKNLKSCVKGCFTRTFPVWRSVAALECWLADPAYHFDEDSVFVYMDLVGDTATAGMMTIHYEEDLGNYTCNHFPPFPQIKEGDDITEDAFCRLYVKEFAAKHRLSIPDKAVEGLVGDHAVKELMMGNDYANYYYVNRGKVSLYQITYDEKVVKKCVSIWLDRICKFWKKICYRLGNNRASYIYFISDIFIQYVTEDNLRRVFTEKQWNNIRSIFQSTTMQLLEGALIYKERLNKHLPIWTEYLPKLSLKIPVQGKGKYEDWDLIDENSAIAVMGDDTEFPVKEQRPLRLHAGAAEYCFGLKKEDISRRPFRVEARILFKEKLESDVDVNMFIRYKYGYDNSYELVLRPVDVLHAPFREMTAEWRSGYREKKNIGGPKFPTLKSNEEVESDAKRIRNNLMKTSNKIARFLGTDYDHDKVSERFSFDQIGKFLTINTFKLRETLRYYDLNEEVRQLVAWFYGSELYGYCCDLMYPETPKKISKDFMDDYKDTSELNKMRNSAAQLIYSFGVYVPGLLQQYLAVNYHSLDFEYKQSILLNLVYKNTENENIWFLLLELFQKKPYSIILNIRSLSNLCWCDERFVPKLGLYPALIRKIIADSTEELQKLQNISKSDDKYESARKRYLSIIEVILAVLRLREDPEFDILTAGTRESMELADLIRQVDDMMDSPESRIKLLVEKPDTLCNMSNIAYAVDRYLTGDEGVDSIEVLSVESDES